MTSKKSIIIKTIVLSISLAIIIAIIIIGGFGIKILKAKAPADHKTLNVAALQLNKLYSKELNFDQQSLGGKDLKVGNDLNLVAGLTALKSKDKQLLAQSLDKNDKQLLVSELNKSKSLLLNELTGEQRQLDLGLWQSLLKLQPSLTNLG
jgi:hypothetical protein|nr:hypothetical protein [uncultured bacterium]